MRWFLYAPLQLLIMIICYITNPIVVLFADKNGELLPIIDRLKRYCCRVFWLMRNCAYGFAVDWFGATINPDNVVVIDDYRAGESERNILVTRDLKYWKIYNSMQILNTKYRWKIYLGWKIHNVKSIHRAMLAFRIWVCKAN